MITPMRADGVGQDLEVRPLDVEALGRALAEQRERDEVHDEAQAGDDQHRHTEHLGLTGQPAHRLDEDVDRHAEEQEGVDEGGQDLQSVQAERVLPPVRLLGVTTGQLDRRQRHAEAEDVGEHVPGIGEEGQRVGQDPADGLDHEEHGDEAEGDGQALLVTGTGPQRPGPVIVIAAHDDQ